MQHRHFSVLDDDLKELEQRQLKKKKRQRAVKRMVGCGLYAWVTFLMTALDTMLPNPAQTLFSWLVVGPLWLGITAFLAWFLFKDTW